MMVALLLSVVGGIGCSPQHYRQKADREMYALVRSAACEPSQGLHDYTILPDHRSRLADPFDPDHEPMPRDDNGAHRLMHCVDCKKQRKCKRCTQTDWIENPRWREYLNTDANGKLLLDKETALELSLRHSPDYQRALENVYLSAVVVSNQRFRFDVQFWGGNSLFYDARGELLAPTNPVTGWSDSSNLGNDASFGFTKTFATGGELAASLANSITWQFAGPDRVQSSSLFNLNVVQPLLRGAGKKIVLENLTQSERDLLANVRQMVFYRQGFYDRVMTGGGVSAPSGGGIGIPGSDIVNVGGANGYYGLLYEQVVIHNEEQNIVRVEDNLRRFEEAFAAGKSDRLSVEEVRNSLYGAQSRLLTRKSGYQTSVEAYVKNTIGLPPDLPVHVQDPLLEQFNLISRNLVDLQAETIEILIALRNLDGRIGDEILAQTAESLERLRKELQVIDHDYQTLINRVPERIRYLQLLEKRINTVGSGAQAAMQIDPRLYSVAFFEEEVASAKTKLDEQWANHEAFRVILAHLQTVSRAELWEQSRQGRLPEEVVGAVETLWLYDLLDPKKFTLEAMRAAPGLSGVRGRNRTDTAPVTGEENADLSEEKLPPEESCFKLWMNPLVDQLSAKIMDASLGQAVIRMNSITLIPVSITPEEALAVASDNRLDWMNARSSLVDQWRKIDVAANALKSDLSIRFDGEAGTIDNDGLKFDAKNSSLRAGIVWDSPLNRHIERNAYRTAQIEYQRARRSYTAYVDNLNASLRTTLRSLERQQVEFEIARAMVSVSTMSVDLAQLELSKPVSSTTAKREFDPSLATRLIDKLSGLLSAQNEFLQLWVGYESLRMGLDLQLGTMRLDANGRWVDPGPITSDSISRHLDGSGALSTSGTAESQAPRSGDVSAIPDFEQPVLAPQAENDQSAPGPDVPPPPPQPQPTAPAPVVSPSDASADHPEMRELREILEAAEREEKRESPLPSAPPTLKTDAVPPAQPLAKSLEGPFTKQGGNGNHSGEQESASDARRGEAQGELKPSYANRSTRKVARQALLRPENATSPDTLPRESRFKPPLTARDAPPPPRAKP